MDNALEQILSRGSFQRLHFQQTLAHLRSPLILWLCVVQLHLWPQTSCFIVHRSSTQILHMLAVTKCGWYLEVTESEHMMHKLSLLVDSFLSSCPEDELAAQLGWRAELVRGEAGLWRLAACGLAYMLVL